MQFDERPVTAVGIVEQILGWALFDNSPVFQKHDPMGAGHGRQPMRDDHDEFVLGGLFEGLNEIGLRLWVESGSGFIEDEDARVLKEAPGDGDALLLADG